MKFALKRSEKAKVGHLYLDVTANTVEAIVNEKVIDSERSELMVGLYRYLRSLYGADKDVFLAVWELVPHQTETKKAIIFEALRLHPTLTPERARMTMLKVLEKFPERSDICSLWAKSLEWESGEEDLPVMDYAAWKRRYEEMKHA